MQQNGNLRHMYQYQPHTIQNMAYKKMKNQSLSFKTRHKTRNIHSHHYYSTSTQSPIHNNLARKKGVGVGGECKGNKLPIRKEEIYYYLQVQ